MGACGEQRFARCRPLTLSSLACSDMSWQGVKVGVVQKWPNVGIDEIGVWLHASRRNDIDHGEVAHYHAVESPSGGG